MLRAWLLRFFRSRRRRRAGGPWAAPIRDRASRRSQLFPARASLEIRRHPQILFASLYPRETRDLWLTYARHRAPEAAWPYLPPTFLRVPSAFPKDSCPGDRAAA